MWALELLWDERARVFPSLCVDQQQRRSLVTCESPGDLVQNADLDGVALGQGPGNLQN